MWASVWASEWRSEWRSLVVLGSLALLCAPSVGGSDGFGTDEWRVSSLGLRRPGRQELQGDFTPHCSYMPHPFLPMHHPIHFSIRIPRRRARRTRAVGMSCIMSKRTSSYSSTITLSRCLAKFTHSPNTPHSAFPTHYPHTLYHSTTLPHYRTTTATQTRPAPKC